MSFSPKYQAQFAGALVNQAIAILQRDFAGAIGEIAAPPGRNYAALQQYKKSLVPAALNTPSIIVGSRQVGFIREDDLNMIPEIHRMLFRLELEDQDPEFCAQAAYDYTLALDQVIRSSQLTDWMNPLPINHPTVTGANTTGIAAFGAVLDVFVELHDFGVLWESPKGFGMRPSMTVLIETEEK